MFPHQFNDLVQLRRLDPQAMYLDYNYWPSTTLGSSNAVNSRKVALLFIAASDHLKCPIPIRRMSSIFS
jgi:hypothetical protein